MKQSPLSALLVLFALNIGCYAETKTFRVIDQENNPVADAVIEINTAPHHRDVSANRTRQTHIMDQVDKSFVPSIITIQQGDRVNFPNSDNIRHHVYSFSEAKSFELKLYSGQPKAPIVFPKHGVVVLGCNIHDSMVGYIYVARDSHVYRSNANGEVQIDISQPIQSISVWHPNQAQAAEKLLEFALDKLPSNGNGYTIELSTVPPEPRNTFEDVFNQ